MKDKSPIRTSLSKRKRPESASQMQDLGEENISSTFDLHVFFLVHARNSQGVPDISYEFNKEEISKEMQKLRRNFTLKKRPGSIKMVVPFASRIRPDHCSATRPPGA